MKQYTCTLCGAASKTLKSYKFCSCDRVFALTNFGNEAFTGNGIFVKSKTDKLFLKCLHGVRAIRHEESFFVLNKNIHRQGTVPKEKRDAFYKSQEWISLRYLFWTDKKPMCANCYAIETEMHTDHIDPVSLFWEKRLDIKNLQILCRECNLGKSNMTKAHESKLINSLNKTSQ